MVGLALGVVGLAGLIGAFKDTIDLFSIVADTRHLGQQYEILDTKFDIEKTLLLQWADRVKLLDIDYDKRLDDPNTQKLVVQILASITSILTDTNNLQQRYGLRQMNDSLIASVPSDITTPLLSELITSLPSDFITSVPLSSKAFGPPSDMVALDQSLSLPQDRRRISQKRMDRFKQEFGAVQLRINIRDKTASI